MQISKILEIEKGAGIFAVNINTIIPSGCAATRNAPAAVRR